MGSREKFQSPTVKERERERERKRKRKRKRERERERKGGCKRECVCERGRR